MPMTPQDRKAELVRKGVRQADIARRTGHSPTYVNDVLTGKRRSETIEREIARSIGRPVEKVFGSATA